MPSIQAWNERLDQLESAYEQKLILLWRLELAKEQILHDVTRIEKEEIFLKQEHPYFAMLRAQRQKHETEQKQIASPAQSVPTPKFDDPETGPFQWRPDMIKRPVHERN